MSLLDKRAFIAGLSALVASPAIAVIPPIPDPWAVAGRLYSEKLEHVLLDCVFGTEDDLRRDVVAYCDYLKSEGVPVIRNEVWCDPENGDAEIRVWLEASYTGEMPGESAALEVSLSPITLDDPAGA